MIKKLMSYLLGNSIKKLFIFLGPIYIKIGQILSYDYPILNELYTLQNKCPDIKKEDLIKFQKKYPQLNISDNSIANGSIAVVHKGLYKEKEIAIKIKRPNIEKVIENSIWYTKILVNFILWIPIFRFLNLKEKIYTVINLYKEQTNFIKEVNNWKLFKEANKNSSNIITPLFFEDQCNDEILVMEYLEGNNIISENYRSLNENEKVKIGNSLVSNYFSGIINGVVHGDLHCGNIAYRDDKVIIYDYGIIIELSDHEKEGMINILNGLFKKDIKYTITNFIKYFVINEDNNKLNLDNIKYENFIDINKKPDVIDLFFKVKKYIELNNLNFNNKMILFELSILPINSTINYINVKKNFDYLLEYMAKDIANSILEL